MRKQIFKLFIVGVLLVLCLVSCEKSNNQSQVVSSNESQNVIDVFCEKMNGVWVDLESCSSNNGFAVFDFVLFSDKNIQNGSQGGHSGKIGEINTVVELSNDFYEVTVYYPEIENEMDGHLDEQYVNYTLKVSTDFFYFLDSPEIIYSFMGDNLETAEYEVVKYNQEKINLRAINKSASEYLQDYLYDGGNYIEWEIKPFSSKNQSIYHLKLDGSEKGYYLYDDRITLTVRNDIIIGAYQDGIQVSQIENVYQLLKWLGGDEEKLLEIEPVFKFEDKSMAYLIWETGNGYFVVYTSWYDGLTDWKKSIPWNYCIYIK